MEYSEPELIVPSLKILSEKDGLTTTELHAELRKRLKPTGKDLKILSNRSDDHFSQKVRNLKSHNSLVKKGFADFNKSRHFITKAGRKFALENSSVFQALRRQGFEFRKRKSLASRDYKNVVIEEGSMTVLPVKVRARSGKLTDFARQHYADAKGRITCVGCGFEGTKVYGKKGKGLVEIHHLEPLHLNQGKSEKAALLEAVKKVVPLCPSCHRYVHRKRDKLVTVKELKKVTGYKG